jgi:hypothetical protein
MSDNVTPMCKRALALLIEARSILEDLVESGQVRKSSPPASTLWYLEDAIGMLTPDDNEPPQHPRLRLV